MQTKSIELSPEEHEQAASVEAQTSLITEAFDENGEWLDMYSSFFLTEVMR